MQSRPLTGMGLMVLAGLSFVIFVASVKALGGAIPAAEGAFLRFVFGLVFLIPAVPQMRRFRPGRRDLLLFCARGGVHTLAVLLWFMAMARIPLAEVTAIGYLSPIWVMLAAALFLGERLSGARIAAVLGALAGALILLRPGFRELGPGHLAMIGAALGLGSSYVLAKSLSERFPASVVVAWLSLVVPVFLAPLALADWVWPSAAQTGLLMVSAAFATAGHYLMTLAFRAAPVAVTQPVTFLQLVWSASLGALAFGEAVDPLVIAGAAVIVAAVSASAWSERRRRAALAASGPDAA